MSTARSAPATTDEVAQQRCSALPGSVSPELPGIRFDDDPGTSLEWLLDALLVGYTG